MLFNSFDFLLFYPIVTVFYYLLSQRFRWLWLLAASCYFYMFFRPVYILILAGTIIIDYFVGLYLPRLKQPKKKLLLVLSLVANIGVLAIFKYYNFFVDNVNFMFHNSHLQLSYLDVLLPIGLSFHTFQAMSYTIEVYRGNQTSEKHFGIYALYVMFYPQLVAGPIERPQNVLHQFREKKVFCHENVTAGLKLMLWGFFKKIAVADRLSPYVDSAYNDYFNQTGSTLLLATFFFAIQIYCDFSGYSDIALGTAKTMGFDLMQNFRRPYLAANITDFWRRWHISLSTWFKDYLYIPLGGSKVSTLKVYRNILIVFLLSGLWHGANWTFIIWGLLHGFFNIADKWLRDKGFTKKVTSDRFSLNKLSSILFNFSLVSIAWIFFRANNLHQAFSIIYRIVTGTGQKLFVKTGSWMLLSILSIIIVLASDIMQEYKLKLQLAPGFTRFVSYAGLVVTVFYILLFGVFKSNQFIYFQF